MIFRLEMIVDPGLSNLSFSEYCIYTASLD